MQFDSKEKNRKETLVFLNKTWRVPKYLGNRKIWKIEKFK